MAEKYIDLGPQIGEDTRKGLSSACHLAQLEGLRWLDEHPEALPGRTITQSEADEACSTLNYDEVTGFKSALDVAGITVIPDPKPTIPVPTTPGTRFIAHSSKLSDDPEDQREFVIAGDCIVALDSAAVYSRELFENAGWIVTALVTAPEGRNEH